MVQWFGLYIVTAEGSGSIPGQGTKIPQIAWIFAPKKIGKKQIMNHCIVYL